MSAETFLLLTVLAHRARSRFFLQLTRYINYLLTYLLAYLLYCCIGNQVVLQPWSTLWTAGTTQPQFMSTAQWSRSYCSQVCKRYC